MKYQESYLYKYRAIDEDNLSRVSRIFTDSEVYFSSKDQFNDPFDCKFDYSFVANDKQIKNYLSTNVD